ncbi:MAG: hypothetical protein FJ294_12555 [Planctomycetes bacterium]|nr:hypothetical protein [Planctomycetota bacterium]
MRPAHRFSWLSCTLLLVGLVSPARADEVDFAALAKEFFERHPLEGRAPAEVSFEDVLESHYALAQVGAIDVRIPREFLADKGRVEDFKDSLAAVLATHQLWLDWIGAPASVVAAARADIADVLKFLKTAKAGVGAAKCERFFDAFAGGASLAPALDRLRVGFRSGTMLGLTPLSMRTQVLVLAPTREHFLQLAGVLGQRQEGARSLYWNDGLATWTEFGWQETQVIALQYPPIKPNLKNLSEGVAMDSREPTGLLQNVAQRAAVTLCWHTFGHALDAAFETAIGQVAVIDLYGENNTRSGGSGRSNSTDGFTAFIPGGRSEGGLLPPNNSESLWREGGGKDYFVKVLQEGQKSGAKGGAKTKDERLLFFQLRSDDTSKRTFVRAPFLGSVAQGKELPAREFLTDYLEFFRAYKSCFLHWLREQSAPQPAESRAKFAQLLRQVAEAGSAVGFEELVSEVYSVPLSGVDLTQDGLERRFLAWLAAQ